MIKQARYGPSKISPEFIANLSVQSACLSAGAYTARLSAISDQRIALLKELVYFHHYMATIAMFHAITDSKLRLEFGEGMLDSIKDGDFLSAIQILPQFSIKDQEDAVKDCFFGVFGLTAVARLGLYIHREPSEKELALMTSPFVQRTIGWSPESADSQLYLAAALLARLALSLGIEVPFPAFFALLEIVVTEYRLTPRLYLEAFGLEVSSRSSNR